MSIKIKIGLNHDLKTGFRQPPPPPPLIIPGFRPNIATSSTSRLSIFVAKKIFLKESTKSC